MTKLLENLQEIVQVRVSKAVIDTLYAQVQQELKEKPRTYRRKARQQYLAIAKQRRPKANHLR